MRLEHHKPQGEAVAMYDSWYERHWGNPQGNTQMFTAPHRLFQLSHRARVRINSWHFLCEHNNMAYVTFSFTVFMDHGRASTLRIVGDLFGCPDTIVMS